MLHGSARYSAWSGQSFGSVPEPEQVLDAMADTVLSDGVDSALTRLMHQGLDSRETGQLPGLDALKNQLRARQQESMRDLLDKLDSDSVADATTGDEQVRRMLNALRSQSPVFPGLIDDASTQQRSELEGLLQASAPAVGRHELTELLDHLLDLSALERNLRSVRDVQDLADIDPDRMRRVLGEQLAGQFDRLAAGMQAFAESGYVTRVGTPSTLSARAVQHIGDALLQSTIATMQSRTQGAHLRHDAANRHEPAGSSRDYQFGDPFELDLARSLLEAVKRNPGAQVRFSAEDLKIIEHESSERATTILAIDLSRSMGERGYLLAAKKLALALTTFIQRRFPHDELLLIGFSESARPIQLQELVDLRWDRYGFGTNMHDALRLANGLLAAHRGRQRNVILITDGEPTAHRNASGVNVFNHPPEEETLALTFREAARLRRDGIYLCVCVLSASASVSNFGRDLARYAAGDVVLTDPDNLSSELVQHYRVRR